MNNVSIDDADTFLLERLKGDEYFDGDEIQVRLQNAILTLPEKQRLVFNMKYNEEMKYEEMSEILGTSVGALKASYHHAVKKMNLQGNSLLFIENVGNLVCPALFDLGENKRVVLISVTEGDDKPLKYPYMFDSADICIINKIDLLPYVDSKIERIRDNALKINSNLIFFELSATVGTGIDRWCDFLCDQVKKING